MLNRAFAATGGALESISVDATDGAVLKATLVGGQWRGRRCSVLRDWMATKDSRMGKETLIIWSLHALLDGGELFATSRSLGFDKLWLKNVDKMVKVLLAEEIQELLNHVISIVVSDQTEQHALSFTVVVAHNHSNDIVLPGFLRVCETLLYDIAGELVLAVAFETFEHKFKNSLPIGQESVFDNMLCHVVAERVTNQGGHAVVQLGEDCLSCHILAVLKASLNDSASICMDTQMLNLASKGLEDERNVLSVATLDGLLDDVVSVLVLDASQHIFLQFANE